MTLGTSTMTNVRQTQMHTKKMRTSGGLCLLRMSRSSSLIQVKKEYLGNTNYFTFKCSFITFSSYTVMQYI